MRIRKRTVYRAIRWLAPHIVETFGGAKAGTLRALGLPAKASLAGHPTAVG